LSFRDPTAYTVAAGITYQPPQRKTFYANGYYWQFYAAYGDLYYKSTSDPTDWSKGSSALLRTGAGGMLEPILV